MTKFNVCDRVRYVGMMHSMQNMTGTIDGVEPGMTLQGAVLISTVYAVQWDDGDYGPRLREDELEAQQ